jgi:aspartyl-tRNA(Asn)/glutamyl-tRNA(Gln) amidotransferase subunit A
MTMAQRTKFPAEPVQDLANLTATQLLSLFRSRTASPVEVIEAVFKRIERVNGEINAFCLLDKEAALSAARESERRWRRGEPAGFVDGVPVSVKDLSYTAGWPTLRASRALLNRGPWDEDSPSVARMREHGAILFGKTTVPEFATRVITHSEMCGITRNPWNLTKTPGGSSGGAAASVAAGMGAIALASDAAGSIRVPAAFTGMFGHKPTFGLVPDYPSSYLGTLAVIGPITRSVEDGALALTVMSEPDDRDHYSLPYKGEDFRVGLDRGVDRLRIAYSPTLGFASVDPEVREIVDRAAHSFADIGATVEIVEHVYDSPASILYTLLGAGLANAFRQFEFDEDDRSKMEIAVVESAEAGARIGLLDYLAARREREKFGAALRRFFKDFDLLLAPVSAIPPFEAGVEGPTDERFARLGDWGIALNAGANLSMQPAASVPCGFTSDGLPVGLQVIGPIYGDALVLRACRAFEARHPILLPELAAATSKEHT